MAKAPKKPEGQEVRVLYAVNRIIYGKQQSADAGSFFVPTSESEANELIALGAAREPTDAEKFVAERIAAGVDKTAVAATATPAAPSNVSADSAAEADAEGDAASDDNPLG